MAQLARSRLRHLTADTWALAALHSTADIEPAGKTTCQEIES